MPPPNATRTGLRRLLPPLELRVLIALLIIVGGTWSFLRLGGAVRKGTTEEFDNRILELVRDPDNTAELRGPKWFREAARDVTALGGYTVLILVPTIVCLYLTFIGKHAPSRFIALASLTGWLLSSLLKEAFDRPRPNIVEHLSHAFTSSFPSGHSMMSAVVYLSMGALLSRFVARPAVKIYCLSVAILLSFLVGCSRVLMGVHYPTDVLGGWTAGLVWATFCWLLARRWQKSHPAEAAANLVDPNGGAANGAVASVSNGVAVGAPGNGAANTTAIEAANAVGRATS